MTTSRLRSMFMLLACVGLFLPMFGSNALAQENTGTIDVEIYVCPEGVDPFGHIDGLTTQCVVPSDPIGILVTSGSGYFQLSGELSPGEPPQQVHIEGVPPGDIVITPQLPDGYDNVSVYCREDEGPIEVITLNLEGGAPWTLQADATLSCQLIVFPVDTGATPVAAPVVASSSLTVFVHGCPSGFDGGSATELVDACTGHPVSGMYVSDLPDYYASATTSGIAGENSVTFTDVPAANLSLVYLYPRSFTSLAVLCDAGSGSNDPSTWLAGSIVSGLSIQVPVEPGVQLTCHWFNDAGDVEGDSSGNTLEVMAWNCPAGTEPGDDSWTSYLRECDDPSLGTTFTLVGPGAPEGTISNEWHLWQGVPAGEFALEATVAEGYGTPMIFCATTSGDRTRIERPAMPDGPHAIAFDDAAPGIMNCDWFNFPNGEGSPTANSSPALEVSVYACPSFTFVGPPECEIDQSGLNISLLQWNGDPAVWAWEGRKMMQGGDTGIFTFEDLDPGDYWVQPHDGAWCHVESDALDASGRWIDVEPGAVTTVSLYSCASPEV